MRSRMRESASTDLREPQGSNPLGPPGPELWNSEAANLGSQAALGQELTSSEPRVPGWNAWLFRRPPVEPVIPGRDHSPRNWDRVRGVTREPAQCRRASRERAGG